MNILNRFSKKSNQIKEYNSVSKVYPISGLFFRTESGIFYIKSGKRFKVFSEACFKSWSSEAISAPFSAISSIPYGGVLGFRDGTIIHNLADGKIYIVSDGKRIHLKSPYIFPEGWLEDKKILVSQKEVDIHKDGQEINAN